MHSGGVFGTCHSFKLYKDGHHVSKLETRIKYIYSQWRCIWHVSQIHGATVKESLRSVGRGISTLKLLGVVPYPDSVNKRGLLYILEQLLAELSHTNHDYVILIVRL